MANISSLVLLVVFWGCAYYFINQAKRTGKFVPLRRIAALDAIKELVGRAVELGKPILLSPTDGATLRGQEAPETMVSLSILSYAAKLCARYNARPIIAVGAEGGAEVLSSVVELTKQAYLSEGKLEQFNPDMIQFVSGDQMSYAAGTMGISARERIASSVLIGPWKGAFIPIALAGMDVGAIQIGGTSRVTMMPTFVALCDHLLIGEEVFAAGAYLSKEPSQVATIAAQDLMKFSAMVLILVGAITVIFGSRFVLDILRM